MPSYRAIGIAGLLIVAAGCRNGGPEMIRLTGKVSLDGKPVRSGRVSVTADNDIGQTSGLLNPDGTYTLLGAPVGPAKFAVNTEIFKILIPDPESGLKPGPNPDYVAIPKRYESPQTSGLAFTVPSGSAVYDIELTSK